MKKTDEERIEALQKFAGTLFEIARDAMAMQGMSVSDASVRLVGFAAQAGVDRADYEPVVRYGAMQRALLENAIRGY